MKFLVYIAFSVAKLFGQAAKNNFPLENMQVFTWNTRHRLYVIKTVTYTDELNSTALRLLWLGQNILLN